MYNELITPTLTNSSIRLTQSFAKKDTTFDWHFHDEFELLWVQEKDKTYFVGDQEYRLLPNDIVFVNERVPHKTETPEGGVCFLLQFNATVTGDHNNIQSLMRFVNRANKEVCVFQAGTEIHALLLPHVQALLRENAEKRKSYASFIKASVYAILAILYRYEIVNDPENFFVMEKTQRLFPVLDYVNEHYAERITIADMSKLLNLDRSYFCRFFKSAVNVSFIEYLYFVRLLTAEKLLVSTDKTISEIAYETGFTSASYFTKIFRERKGCTPNLYKKIRQRKA